MKPIITILIIAAVLGGMWVANASHLEDTVWQNWESVQPGMAEAEVKAILGDANTEFPEAIKNGKSTKDANWQTRDGRVVAIRFIDGVVYNVMFAGAKGPTKVVTQEY